MTGRETPGGILRVPSLDCDSYPVRRDRLILLIKDHLDLYQFCDFRQNPFRVKAPLCLTRMRDWRGRGRKYAWLRSRRGTDWAIDQELYLGWERQQISMQPHAERRRA
jgi:hypothetical protein